MALCCVADWSAEELRRAAPVRRDQSVVGLGPGAALALLKLTGKLCCPLALYVSPDRSLEMQASWAVPMYSVCVCHPISAQVRDSKTLGKEDE